MIFFRYFIESESFFLKKKLHALNIVPYIANKMLTKKHDLLKSLAAVTLKPKKRSFPGSLCTYDKNVNKDLSKGVKVLLRLDCSPNNADNSVETTPPTYPTHEQSPFSGPGPFEYPVKNIQRLPTQLQPPLQPSQPVVVTTLTLPDVQQPVDFQANQGFNAGVNFIPPQAPDSRIYILTPERPVRNGGYLYSIPFRQWSDTKF